MTGQRNLFRMTVFGGAMLLAAWAVAQPQGQEEVDPAMEAWMRAAQPGEHHEHLEPLVGRWSLTVRHRMSPDQEWQESAGTAEFKWIMDGRFLLETVKSQMEDEPFEGMGIIGYDNVAGKHTSVWVDSMGTQTLISRGTCDGSGKVINYVSEFTDPMTGRPKKQKSVQRMINNDKCVFEMYDTGEDGREFKSLEVTYTRR